MMYRVLAVVALGCLAILAFFQVTSGPSRPSRTSTTPAPSGPSSTAITMGVLGLAPKDEVARIQPMADFLARRLKDEGIEQGRVIMASSLEQLAELMRTGQVDLYMDSAFPMAQVTQLSDARPFARRWKKGAAEYHSVIAVRADSGIERLEGLGGKVIALQEPTSTTGYLLPKAMLLQAGLKLTEVSHHSAVVAPDQVGYVMTRADENTIYWVLEGKVAGGGTSNQDLTQQARERVEELRVLQASPSIPRHIVAHRASLSPHLVSAVTRVLTTMDGDDEGKRVLDEFDKTTKFDQLPPEWDTAVAEIRRLARLIEADLQPAPAGR